MYCCPSVCQQHRNVWTCFQYMPFLWSCNAMALSFHHTCASSCFNTFSRPVMTSVPILYNSITFSLAATECESQVPPAAASVMQPAMPCQYRVTSQQEACGRRFDNQPPCISPPPPRIPWMHISYGYFVLNLDILECFPLCIQSCESLQSMMSSWMQHIPRRKRNESTKKDEILSPMFLRMQLICRGYVRFVLFFPNPVTLLLLLNLCNVWTPFGLPW